VRQYLRAGLIDHVHIHVVPVLLGGGARLFEDTGGARTRYALTRVVATPTVTHHRFRLAEAARA